MDPERMLCLWRLARRLMMAGHYLPSALVDDPLLVTKSRDVGNRLMVHMVRQLEELLDEAEEECDGCTG